ncbi:MAG: hypothetical protein JSU03_09195 [Bacteroidetes bacterium]|nr:hypothetical protein [Bacteroidota bacterium]MBS1757440.1 hypothetical protein [Bacteroidota bacterium]
MKVVKKLTILFSVSAIVFASCTNDDSPANTQTNLTLLQNNWQVDSITTHFHTSIKDSSVTYLGQPSDYFNFNTNGNLYQQLNNVKDTASYSLLNSNTLVITQNTGEKDTATISLLTSNKLAANYKKLLNATDYIEVKSYMEH